MRNETKLNGALETALQNEQRRKVMKIATVGIAAGFCTPGFSAEEASTGGKVEMKLGDLLVADDAEDGAAPLTPADLKPGKPVLAFPYDPKTKTIRSGSRLNKVLLLRLEDSKFDEKTKALAANGILGFSAICTHQACEIKTWMAKQRVLACYCHSSMFQPLESGAVVSGPAPRALPTLPLKIVDGKLTVAGPFSAQPGLA
jgi:Rieske Fe-S protein